MNYGSCNQCGKLIKYVKLSLCNDCKDKFLHTIKDYLYENGVHNPKEISCATGVPVRVIEFFLNNGDLNSITKESNESKTMNNEEVLKQMALLEALKDSFKEEKQEELKGEYHFIGRKG